MCLVVVVVQTGEDLVPEQTNEGEEAGQNAVLLEWTSTSHGCVNWRRLDEEYRSKFEMRIIYHRNAFPLKR